MKPGTQVTFNRCHHLHPPSIKEHLGLSGYVTGKTANGKLLVQLDNGSMIALSPQWLIPAAEVP